MGALQRECKPPQGCHPAHPASCHALLCAPHPAPCINCMRAPPLLAQNAHLSLSVVGM